MKKITLLVCFLSFLVNNTFSQIDLVKDIVTTDGDSWPSGFIEGNGFTVFNYFGNTTEIWASDGTPNGTVKISTNIPRIFNLPDGSASIGNNIFFVIENEALGGELYKSDGTLAGTSLIKDINTNPNIGSSPFYLTSLNNKVFFTADDGTNGQKLWVTDGTEAGTMILSNSPQSPSDLFLANGIIYFTADDGTNGSELWKTDGTDAGTVQVKDINNGASSSFPSAFYNVNGTVYFRAENGANGAELWKTDGTEAGTIMVKDINPGASSGFPENFIYNNNVLLFTADDGVNGTELWKSDGTEAGTVLVRDLEAGASSTQFNGFIALGNLTLFAAETSATGLEIFVTDGNGPNTHILKDINPGNLSGMSNGSSISPVELNGNLYFSANDGTNGMELWKTDGTEAGTMMVKNINTDVNVSNGNGLIGGLYVVNNKIIFEAFDTTYNRELWQSDGTEAGTTLLKDINPNTAWGTSMDATSIINNKLIFVGNGGNDGFEPWVTDGTEAGTLQLKNLNTTPDSSNPTRFVNALGKLFFAAQNTNTEENLWVTDGTTAGTHKVNSIIGPKAMTEYKDKLYVTSSDFGEDYGIFYTDLQDAKVLVKKINPNGFANITEFFHFSANDELFFAASDGTNGKELWKTDGTTAGTVLVKDLVAGADGILSIEFYEFNNVLYFMSQRSTGGNTSIKSLWKTDGTDAGTTLLKEFSNFNNPTTPYFTAYNGKLYFAAYYQPNGGTHLWETDGTIAGTIASYVGFNNPRDLVVIDTNLFMSASDNTNGREMWKYDGTDATLFKEFHAGASDGYYPSSDNSVVNGIYYFNAYEGTNYGIWKTDGTLAGTTKVFDSGSDFIGKITVGNTHIYFPHRDNTNNQELWKSDGTQAGTEMVQDLFPGNDDFGNPNGSRPEGLIIFGTDLFFTATNEVNGTELFKIANVALGIDDFENATNNQLTISIHPNPTTAFIKITSTDATIKQIKIYNILGKEVMMLKSNGNQQSFNVSHLNTGLYLVKILTDKGSVTKKIVKN